jgi:hypothetical protein
MSCRTSAHGASIAFRLRQLSEVLRAFQADAQGRQRVRFDPFGAPNGICVPRWSLSSTDLKGAVHGDV